MFASTVQESTLSEAVQKLDVVQLKRGKVESNVLMLFDKSLKEWISYDLVQNELKNWPGRGLRQK